MDVPILVLFLILYVWVFYVYASMHVYAPYACLVIKEARRWQQIPGPGVLDQGL